MTEKKLIKIAREEIDQWSLPRAIPMAILWAFIYRLTRGRSIEQDFFTDPPKTSLDSAQL